MKKKYRYYYSTHKAAQDVYHILKDRWGRFDKSLCGQWDALFWEISDTPPKGRRLCVYCKLRLKSKLKLRNGKVIHAKQKELI